MMFQTGIVRGKVIDADRYLEEWAIREAPQFYRADVDMVYRLGGPLYRRILDAMPIKGDRAYVTIDSRVHMMMPGWWPCIPGWHCDDFYRFPKAPYQPDLRAIAQVDRLKCIHHMMMWGTAPTEFVALPFELPPEVHDSPKLYKTCNRLIESANPETFFVKQGEIVTFGSLDFHRGTQATQSGWRLFVRATESDIYGPINEIRTQTQVYLSDPGAGW